MKAAIIKRWGDENVFKISDMPVPKPEPDQLLIKVFTSSINPVDWKHRAGYHKYILGAPFPITLGYDVCGEVVETGTNVKSFNVGDIVFGDLDKKYGGGLAEFAVGSEQCFAIKPYNVSFAEACAYPLAGLTALQALRDVGKLKAEQAVLIIGASGGVGHLSVQIARKMRAKVTAVASSESRDFVMQFKPHCFIDYKKESITDITEKFDVIFDVAGVLSFLKSKHLLMPGGIYINPHPRIKIMVHKLLQVFNQGKQVKTFVRKHNMEDMSLLAKWIGEGSLKVKIDKQFELENISVAHKYAQAGHTKGKNIVVISK